MTRVTSSVFLTDEQAEDHIAHYVAQVVMHEPVNHQHILVFVPSMRMCSSVTRAIRRRTEYQTRRPADDSELLILYTLDGRRHSTVAVFPGNVDTLRGFSGSHVVFDTRCPTQTFRQIVVPLLAQKTTKLHLFIHAEFGRNDHYDRLPAVRDELRRVDAKYLVLLRLGRPLGSDLRRVLCMYL